MAIAKVIAWPKLAIVKKRSVTLRIERAVEYARQTSEQGEMIVTHARHRRGYMELAVSSDKVTRWLTLYYKVHFAGPYTEVPDFDFGRKIRFRLRSTPLRGGDPKEPSSYLEIEYVR